MYFQVFKPLVDKVDIFKTKKLPVEFLSDNKLVFQEYTHLKTITVSLFSTNKLRCIKLSEFLTAALFTSDRKSLKFKFKF